MMQTVVLRSSHGGADGLSLRPDLSGMGRELAAATEQAARSAVARLAGGTPSHRQLDLARLSAHGGWKGDPSPVIGRSRGGLNSKINVIVGASGLPASSFSVPGRSRTRPLWRRRSPAFPRRRTPGPIGAVALGPFSIRFASMARGRTFPPRATEGSGGRSIRRLPAAQSCRAFFHQAQALPRAKASSPGTSSRPSPWLAPSSGSDIMSTQPKLKDSVFQCFGTEVKFVLE